MANKRVLNCFIITYPENANPSEILFSTIRLAKIHKKKIIKIDHIQYQTAYIQRNKILKHYWWEYKMA